MSDSSYPAVFMKKITVTFISDSEIIKSDKYSPGSKYGQLPIVSKPNHEFVGWFTNENGGVQISEDTIISIESDHSIYAHFIRIVTVTLNPNEGLLEKTSFKVKVGSPYGNLDKPNKTKNYFLGWFTQLSGGTEITETTIVTIQNDHTLYAHWEQLYEVTFNSTGGSPISNSLLVRYNHQYGISGNFPTPTKINNEFLGWYTEYPGGTLVVMSSIVSKNKDHVLYAHWEQIFVITLDPNGGTISMNLIVVKDGQQYGELPIPSKVGHSFLGWYTSQNNDSGTKIESSSSFSSNSSSRTLYAHWQIEKYRISFNTMGASTQLYPIEYYYDEFITLPTDVKKEGHIFDGWFFDITYIKPFNLQKMPAENLLLYAKWKEKSKDSESNSNVNVNVNNNVNGNNEEDDSSSGGIIGAVLGGLGGLGGIITTALSYVKKCLCFKKKDDDDNDDEDKSDEDNDDNDNDKDNDSKKEEKKNKRKEKKTNRSSLEIPLNNTE